MSVFEIEGVAKREVPCDLAKIVIKFKAVEKNGYEASKKVMEQCDSFLGQAIEMGMKLEDFQLENHRVDKARYDDLDNMFAERSIMIRIPFDMEKINRIQELLQEGKYDYEIDVDGDISNRRELKMELAAEALNNSKTEAELLAASLGITVKSIESIRRDRWDDEVEMKVLCRGMANLFGTRRPRNTDKIGAKTIEESVNLKVKWNLE